MGPERPGETPRNLIIKEVVQVTHIVAVCEEHSDDPESQLPPQVEEVELILASNRRPVPVPYTEEP
jgi:hypothetical protein